MSADFLAALAHAVAAIGYGLVAVGIVVGFVVVLLATWFEFQRARERQR